MYSFSGMGGGTSGFILHPNLWFNVGKFYWFFNYQIEGVRVLLKPEVMQFMLCLRSAATKPCDTTHTLVRKDHLSTLIASQPRLLWGQGDPWWSAMIAWRWKHLPCNYSTVERAKPQRFQQSKPTHQFLNSNLTSQKANPTSIFLFTFLHPTLHKLLAQCNFFQR